MVRECTGRDVSGYKVMLKFANPAQVYAFATIPLPPSPLPRLLLFVSPLDPEP